MSFTAADWLSEYGEAKAFAVKLRTATAPSKQQVRKGGGGGVRGCGVSGVWPLSKSACGCGCGGLGVCVCAVPPWLHKQTCV